MEQIHSMPSQRNSNLYLQPISNSKNLTISACSRGEKTSIAHAHNIFPGGIDRDFVQWGCDVPQRATATVYPEMYEMHNLQATVKTMFGSLCPDLVQKYSCSGISRLGLHKIQRSLKSNGLVFTQQQIIRFVQENPKSIHIDNYGTFFLFTEIVEMVETYFVARVGLYYDKLQVGILRLSSTIKWSPRYLHRVVVPPLV